MQISDKAIVFYVVVGTLVLLAMGFFIVLFLLLYNRKYKLFELQRTEAEKAFSNALLNAKYEIRESTLKDIGRELHDNIGQTASLIKIHLLGLAARHPNIASPEVEHIMDLTRTLIRDVKMISRDLIYQTPLEHGLWSSIIRDIHKINASGALEVSDYVKQDLPGWDSGIEIIFYRMVQELFQNAIKHSQASLMVVEGHVKDNDVVLSISDNGIGFDLTNIQQKGSGLANLEVRASAIGAMLKLSSTPGKGTSVTITKRIQTT